MGEELIMVLPVTAHKPLESTRLLAKPKPTGSIVRWDWFMKNFVHSVSIS